MSSTLDQVLLNKPPPSGAAEGGQEGKDNTQPQQETFIRDLFQSLVLGTKASNAIPKGKEIDATSGKTNSSTSTDYDFHASFPQFSNKAEETGDQILELIQSVLQHVNGDEDNNNNSNPFSDLLEDIEDPADPFLFEKLADSVEDVLEEVDAYLDKATGTGNQQITVAKGQLKNFQHSIQTKNVSKFSTMVSQVQHSMEKPQLKFEETIDNRRDIAFIPKLTIKPNAIVPLDLKPIVEDETNNLNTYTTYLHPYEKEIVDLSYTSSQLLIPGQDDLTIYLTKVMDLSQYPDLKIVSTLPELMEMVTVIEKNEYKEIAVDLEAHSYHSFQGIVCLMQLSTRNEDYIIDTLALRSHMHILNDIFTRPNIVKVFHGAESDIKWLQRDFGIYVVNMFDTYHACKRLNYPAASLAYLLKQNCNITADKKYQLSDWRIRPLSDEMVKYAREDTHYLLYIYDNLRLELATADAVKDVLDASRITCLKKYEKEKFYPKGYEKLLKRSGLSFNSKQINVLAVLWDWRDRVAREKDENFSFILPNNIITRIAKVLPKTHEALMACANPVPAAVRESAEDLVNLISATINKPEENSSSSINNNMTLLDVNGINNESNGGTNGIPTPTNLSKLSATASPFTLVQPNASSASAQLLRRSSPSPNPLHTSPVLQTDELYITAGWMTPIPSSKNDDENVNTINNKSPSVVKISDVNEGFDTRSKLEHSLVLGEDPTVCNKESTSNDVNSEDMAGIATASRIRDEIAKNPLMSITNADFMVEDDSDNDDDAAGNFNDIANKIASEEDEDKDDDEGEDIPKSMSEIYRISNRNRRRNKEKKKLRETENDSTAGADDEAEDKKATTTQDEKSAETQWEDDEAVNGYFNGRKRKKNEEDDTLEFMENVGWLDSEYKEQIMKKMASAANGQQQGANGQPTTVGGNGTNPDGFNNEFGPGGVGGGNNGPEFNNNSSNNSSSNNNNSNNQNNIIGGVKNQENVNVIGMSNRNNKAHRRGSSNNLNINSNNKNNNNSNNNLVGNNKAGGPNIGGGPGNMYQQQQQQQHHMGGHPGKIHQRGSGSPGRQQHKMQQDMQQQHHQQQVPIQFDYVTINSNAIGAMSGMNAYGQQNHIDTNMGRGPSNKGPGFQQANQQQAFNPFVMNGNVPGQQQQQQQMRGPPGGQQMGGNVPQQAWKPKPDSRSGNRSNSFSNNRR